MLAIARRIVGSTACGWTSSSDGQCDAILTSLRMGMRRPVNHQSYVDWTVSLRAEIAGEELCCVPLGRFSLSLGLRTLICTRAFKIGILRAWHHRMPLTSGKKM